MSDPDSQPRIDAEAPLPFVAPCRHLAPSAPLSWVRAGWRDIRAAPAASLSYGLIIVLLSYLVSGMALVLGNWVIFLSLLSGFVFVGPVLAIGTYAISAQLQRGQKPSLFRCMVEKKQCLGNAMVFALMLLVIFLVWARAASMVHVFFPMDSSPDWRDLVRFYAIGSAVGSIFAAICFSAAAFSLPMLLDRDVDAVTAVVTSVNAVLRNKPAMAVWVTIIVLALAVGFATAFLGMAVLMPLIGHATWHAYRDTIDASAWRQRGPVG